ncbi:MAG: CtsR family transcriptional regulator [Bacteroidota bacterium]
MYNLADAIERYLRQMLAEREILEIKRRELATLFRCVPSQINYVLGTRFTLARGYIVDSRRGGGGYIRITRLPEGDLTAALGERLDPEEVPKLLARMVEEGVISQTEAVLLERALCEALGEASLDPGVIRAHVLRTILTLLARRAR